MPAPDELQPLRGALVELVALAPEHHAEVQRIHSTTEVAAGGGRPIQRGRKTIPTRCASLSSRTVGFAVVADGAVVGMVQYSEEPAAQYHHAGLDIFLDPAVHGRGLGRDAVATLARHLIDARGHHRLVIDPAAAASGRSAATRPSGFVRSA